MPGAILVPRTRTGGGLAGVAVRPDALVRGRVRAVTSVLAAEFDGVIAAAVVERVVQDSAARLGDVIGDFVPVLADFARERLIAAGQVAGRVPKAGPQILFICTRNAGRPQMAVALTRHLTEGRLYPRSAGSDPAAPIEMAVVDVMAEIGVDMSFAYPKPLTDEVLAAADVVVTMGCGDVFPVIPGPRYLDWHIDDPAGRDASEVRRIRYDIANHLLDLLKDLLP